MNRINRISAILIQLQSKKIVTAKEIAERFDISTRTVYRDIRTLEEAGIPIGNEPSKGYFLVEGFHLPPVMFSLEEVTALITAGKVLPAFGDPSLLKNYDSALYKIKSILQYCDKDYIEKVENATKEFIHLPPLLDNVISTIQTAIYVKKAINVNYHANGRLNPDYRTVEPISLGFYEHNWYLIAYCQLRQEYRNFRVDRITDIEISEMDVNEKNFNSLEDILKKMFLCNQLQRVVLRVNKGDLHDAIKKRYDIGVIEEKNMGPYIDIVLQTDSLEVLAKQLLEYESGIEIIEPLELKNVLRKYYKEMKARYFKLI